MHYSSEQNVSKTLISLAGLCLDKNGRFWLLSGRREVGAEIRELPENTGDLATLTIIRVLMMYIDFQDVGPYGGILLPVSHSMSLHNISLHPQTEFRPNFSLYG